MNKQLTTVFVICSLLLGITTLNQFAQAAPNCDVKTAEQALEVAKKYGSKKLIEKAQRDLQKAKSCVALPPPDKIKEDKIDQKRYDECMKVIPPGSYTYTKEWHHEYCKKLARK